MLHNRLPIRRCISNGQPVVKHMQYPVKWYEPTNRIDVMAGTFLAGTFGDQPIVNSFHHQGIKLVVE